MFRIVTTNRFEKKLKKYTSTSPEFREKIYNLLSRLSNNPFDQTLNVHKLKGKLDNFYSISCGFDCRIIFTLESNANNEDYLLLIDIGTHDEVY
jgi:mRNA-degrading endonuclease YafQ of YafQ-DinJ toxin-antitoxin module